MANISIQGHFEGSNKLTVAARALLVAAVFLALPARSPVAQSTSHVTAVDPAAGKPNDIVTVSGDGLEKTHVAAVFLSDDKDDHKVVVVSQAADKIMIKIPELKAGDYNISIQSGNAILIEPVHFTVQ